MRPTPVPAAVPDADAAVRAVGLRPEQRLADLRGDDWRAFRRLIGWDPGGPVVACPTPAEQAARAEREAWKAERLGRDRETPQLLLRAEHLQRARRALADGTAPAWLPRLLTAARSVAALPRARWLSLIPGRVPWNTAGSFCPACVGERSDVALHHAPWRWRVDDPQRIACPHCGTVYPHADFPEEGRLALPRLGWTYQFYLSPAERARGDGSDGGWRDGAGASSFGSAPTHVSLSGEAERCALNWLLGQLEPMALAHAITGDRAVGEAVAAALVRLAAAYPGYPLYTYRQEFYDCEPAYAVAHVDASPTCFRVAAFDYTYAGRYGQARDLHGRGDNTVGTCLYPNGEWGASRLAREKASNGQLFLTLLHAYDLVAPGMAAADRALVERDLLLEYYLDVKGLTRHVDNKSGAGTAARVAAGRFWNDAGETAEGIERFGRLLAGQFHADGSWKETPIYGAKSLVEGLWEVPELEPRLYDDEPLLRRAFELYAAAATPAGTQPPLDDSPADFSLSAHLRDLARLRLGLTVAAAPVQLTAFGPLRSGRRGFSGYVPRLDMVPDGEDTRSPGDGGLGFRAVGHITREAADTSWVAVLCGGPADGDAQADPLAAGLDPGDDAARPALTRFLRGRGLACLGAGAGPEAVQLYLDGGDGRRGHRHQAPLALAGFADGFEVLPDLGYIADHRANAWVRTTAAHNTVVADGGAVVAAGRCRLLGFVDTPTVRFADLRVGVRPATAPVDGAAVWHYRRAVALLPPVAPVGRGRGSGPVLLVDVFDVDAADTGGPDPGAGTLDYVVRAGDPGPPPRLGGLPPFAGRATSIFADTWPTPPWDESTAGAAAGGWGTAWGTVAAVGARVLSAADEVMSCRSPAWRTQADVFADPQRAWTALVLRQRGPRARFVVVYALGGEAPRARTVAGLHAEAGKPVVVEVESPRPCRVTIGAGTVRVDDGTAA